MPLPTAHSWSLLGTPLAPAPSPLPCANKRRAVDPTPLGHAKDAPAPATEKVRRSAIHKSRSLVVISCQVISSSDDIVNPLVPNWENIGKMDVWYLAGSRLHQNWQILCS